MYDSTVIDCRTPPFHGGNVRVQRYWLQWETSGQPCRAGGGEALKTSRRSHNEIDHETTGGLWLDMIQLHCVDLQSFSRCGTGLDVEYQRIDGFYLPKKDRFT